MTDAGKHGERGTYLRGCTCEPCREANADYCKRYRTRVYRNGGNIRVDAGPARDHIALLRTHYTVSAIATLAQMNSSAICRISNGQQAKITPDVEGRILAVRPGLDVGRQWVNPIGAMRRVQALCAIGYALHWQGTRLNYQKANMWALVRGDKPYITGAVDRRIRELYDELCMKPRTSTLSTEKASITKAHRMAAREGWAPPLAWDNIDDPDERPNLGAPDARNHNGTRPLHLMVEDAEWLADSGLNLTGVLHRLNVNRDTFRDLLRRADRADLYWRLAMREPDADNRKATRDGIRRGREVA
ncbi:hypothetical protein [Nocardioides sp. J54]|uniref:hypothetical protein n=1 Tax=Nocardioides sp. J54 TaxID=935866 RepID=UPI00048CA5D7|nr:hypothetical protein [Nocardioides sp. J54]